MIFHHRSLVDVYGWTSVLLGVFIFFCAIFSPVRADQHGALQAYRAAKLDALRNLGEEIFGLRLESRTTIHNYATSSDRIQTDLNTFIQGAREIEVVEHADGSVAVTVEIDLAGMENILGQRILSDQAVITAQGYGVPSSLSAAPLGESVVEPMGQGNGLTAQGYGLPPRDSHLSSAEQDLLGFRAAQADAMRNLAESLRQVQLRATTTVQNYAVANDTIQTRIQTLLQGVRVVSKQRLADGRYRVELEIDNYPSDFLR